jgi:hypothetical protein
MNNMKNKNSEIEDALFQIRNLEEALNRNAQGILASTMKEEISSLVKESLKEAEEDEEEIDTEVDSTEDDDSDEDAFDNSEMDLMGDEYDDESDEEETDNLPVANVDLTVGDDEDENEEVIDATPEGLNLSNDEIITVFRSLDPSDSIVVKKENNKIHLKDDEKDVEYLIQLGESEEDEFEMKETGRRHSRMRDDFSYDEMEEMYGRHARKPKFKMDKELDFDFDEFEPGFDLKGDFDLEDEETETIYEVELDEEDEDFSSDKFNMSSLDELYDEESELDAVMESKKGFKAKGMGMGNASKFKYAKKPNMEKGFDEDMKEGPKTKFTGKAKFDYKSDVNSKGFGEKSSKKSTVKKVETKEASRTLGNGDRFRKGGLPKPRTYSSANTAIKKNVNEEVSMLREKNEEYRTALNVFREKLNEVAVFNSNLAYATRLFTEHSTTKQEKINILRRFDNVETLKESKNLYRSIKDELSNGKEKETANSLNESVERLVVKTPSSGSAVNLIESKTYENPQFLRMKDLMSKL